MFDPTQILAFWGTWAVLGVCLIIFIETSTIIGSFLPGDSLLFTLGLVLSTWLSGFPIGFAVPLVFLSAVLGAQVGYLVGRWLGPRMFRNDKARLFNPATLQKGQSFFSEHGNKAIILSRFVPIIRALIPALVGMSLFNPKRFLWLNIAGAALWVVSLMMLGYWLGMIPAVAENVEWVILAVVIITSLPFPVEVLRNYIKRRQAR